MLRVQEEGDRKGRDFVPSLPRSKMRNGLSWYFKSYISLPEGFLLRLPRRPFIPDEGQTGKRFEPEFGAVDLRPSKKVGVREGRI